MKSQLEKLYTENQLSEKEAYDLIINIKEEKFNATQIAALITFFIKRPITVAELSGFRNALLDTSIKVSIDKEAIDVCGTGGDYKNTFNISTLSSFVLAASGVPVAKHGNYGSSSVSGSSDILKHFGYNFKTSSDELNKELNENNLCFIHAPFFHPTLKLVAAQRKELGIRTFFNLLGPLVNPARVKNKYIGVYNLEVARLYNYVLQNENSNYCIVHSIAGYDEVSLTSAFKCITPASEKVYEPIDLGFDYIKEEELYAGNTIEESAKIFHSVLSATATEAQNRVVIVNSALAMQCFYPKKSLADCMTQCEEAIMSKGALNVFKKLINN